MPEATTAILRSINVGRTRAVPWGQLKASAIDKRPVTGPVHVEHLGVVGDEQTDRKHHGGLDQAVYAFAMEDLQRWAASLGRPLAPGCFGENFTTEGLDVNGAVIGERWRVGTAELQVTAPRIPCSVFAGFVGEPNWIKRFLDDGNPGPYLRVLTEGTVTAGDAIDVVHRPAHGVTVRDVYQAKTKDRALARRILEAPELSEAMRTWAEGAVASPGPAGT